MSTVTMYSRPRCGLCDEARRVILSVRRAHPFDFTEINIEDDADLEREYGFRIPVVAIDGVERFELSVDPDALAGFVGRSG